MEKQRSSANALKCVIETSEKNVTRYPAAIHDASDNRNISRGKPITPVQMSDTARLIKRACRICRSALSFLISTTMERKLSKVESMTNVMT